MRALIVDESGSGKSPMSGALADAGFQVLETGDSVEALDALRDRGGVDLALVDWDLPEAQGLRFALALRSARCFDRTRLIMLTREPSTAEILGAIRMGVDDCIVKPFSRKKLGDKLARLKLTRT
jgi:two-component system chemotaxis response regulator CheY